MAGILKAHYENETQTTVNATYANGVPYSGITSASHFWSDVEAFVEAGGVIAPYVDPMTTPEAIAAREKNEREAKTARDATAAAAVLLPLLANESDMSDTTLHALAEVAPDYFDAWTPGAAYAAGKRLLHEGALYVVMQAVTAQEHQPPGAAGMLAVYRPVSPTPEASGTVDDPILYVDGMDTVTGLHYRHNGATWRCVQGAAPCLWAPTDGLPSLWERT